jgi:hypothetical protein
VGALRRLGQRMEFFLKEPGNGSQRLMPARRPSFGRKNGGRVHAAMTY